MTTRSSHSLGASALALCIAFASPAAHAEPRAPNDAEAARVAELNEAGARAYGGRNYRAAIEKFVEAYAIDHDPNLLFNIARSYEKLREVDAAIEKYEAFIAAPGSDTEGRVKAKASLVELQKLRDEGGTSPAASASHGAEEKPAHADEHGARPAPFVRALPWITLGTGAVIAGVGGVVYALGVSDHRTVTDTAGYGDPNEVYPVTRAEAQAYVDSGNSKKLIGGIGMGVGGALVVTGVVLLFTGKSSASSETAGITFVPSAHGAYAGYSGSF